MSMWQPIETAPRDGTRVLLFGAWFAPNRPTVFLGSWEEFNGQADLDGDLEMSWLAEGEYMAPDCFTHWMQIPGAPK